MRSSGMNETGALCVPRVREVLEGAVRARRVTELEELEFEFHRAVNRIAGSRKLSWLLYTTTRYTPGRLLSSDPGWRTAMRTDHEALLAAFATGDAGAARAVMTRHFTDGADRLVKHLDATDG